MTGIIGMADLLAGTHLDDDQRHMVKVIKESSFALTAVISDVLD